MSMLIVETPFAAAVSQDAWAKVCAFCFAMEKSNSTEDHVKLRRCKGCRRTKYCSKECQQNDWNSGQHKRECLVLQKHSNQAVLNKLKESIELRLVARLLSRLENGGATLKSDCFIDDFNHKMLTSSEIGARSFEDLEKSVIIKEDSDPDWWKSLWEVFMITYGHVSKFFDQVEEDRFRSVLGVVRRFSFPIMQYEIYKKSTCLGIGIYLEASRFPHVCTKPDLTYYADRSQMILKISKSSDSPEQSEQSRSLSTDMDTLTLCWITEIHEYPLELWSTEIRHKHLWERFIHDCSCTLCVDQLSDSVKLYGIKSKCGRCFGTLTVSPEQEASLACCGRCQMLYPIPCSIFRKVQLVIRNLERYLCHDVRSVSEPEPFFLWNEAQKFLDPDTNVLLFQLRIICLSYLMEQIEEEQSLSTPALALGYKILDDISGFIKDASGFYAVCLQAVAKLERKAEKHEESMFHYQSAMDMWSRICSPQHYCVKQIEKIVHEMQQEASKKTMNEEDLV